MKSTDELLDALNNSNNIDQYIAENADSIISDSIPQLLGQLLEEKGLKKSEVIKSSEISGSYGYQIFSGEKKEPARDKILAVLIAMKLDLDEIQKFLKAAGYPPLYPKNKRDSIIIFCINEKASVMDVNRRLYDMDEQTL